MRGDTALAAGARQDLPRDLFAVFNKLLIKRLPRRIILCFYLDRAARPLAGLGATCKTSQLAARARPAENIPSCPTLCGYCRAGTKSSRHQCAWQKEKEQRVLSFCAQKTGRGFTLPPRPAGYAVFYRSTSDRISPFVRRVTTRQGMFLPHWAKARSTAACRPPQQGTSIRSTVTERRSFCASIWASLSA